MARLNELPYMLIKRAIPRECLVQHASANVFICCNLMDHRAIGLGATREEALESMRSAYIALNPDRDDQRDESERDWPDTPRFSIN